jgi:hypothetical protein
LRSGTNIFARAETSASIYRDIIKEIPSYVPSDLPVLSGDFRVLHDAAARGSALPDTGDPSRADAATVKSQDLAVTVTDNYASCRADQERLKALREVMRRVFNEN